MISIEGLTTFFKSFKIADLHIQIDEGEFHCLLGPTGSGKTLILESIMGLHRPQEGRVRIGEREVQRMPPEKREISYVPQDLALFPHLKVRENILFGIKARKLDFPAYEKHVNTLIEVMRIDHLLERYPAHLSGGEKKRVALLRALAAKPKLLLLDEPLSGLDPSIKMEIQQLLKALHSSFRPTTLCVTHDFEEAFFLSDRITICMDGKVEQAGNKDEIFLRPQSRKVAEFLGAKNLYRATIVRIDNLLQRVTLEVKGLQLFLPKRLFHDSKEAGKEIDLLIRPEEIMIIREGKPVKESLNRNFFLGRITDRMDQRRDQIVRIQTLEGGVPIEISIPKYASRNLNLLIGQIVEVALREESLWVMN